jgi:hypothetical protein
LGERFTNTGRNATFGSVRLRLDSVGQRSRGSPRLGISHATRRRRTWS